MNDEVLMRVLDRGANCAKELQPLSGTEVIRVHILSDRLAFNVLHDEVRQVSFGCTAIQQPRDVRMIEIGKYLTFVTKTPHDEISVHAALNQFYGGAFGE